MEHRAGGAGLVLGVEHVAARRGQAEPLGQERAHPAAPEHEVDPRLLVTRHERGAHHGGHVRPAVAKRSVRRLAAVSRSKSASTVRRAAAPSRSRRAVSASSSPMASAMAADVVGRGEQAVVAVADEILDPAHRRRHHRQPAGHRLGQHVGHAVAIAVGRDARGQGEHLGPRELRRHLVLTPLAGQLDHVLEAERSPLVLQGRPAAVLRRRSHSGTARRGSGADRARPAGR